jgi:hypothetical protein
VIEGTRESTAQRASPRSFSNAASQRRRLPPRTAHQPSRAATTAASRAHGHHGVEESAGTGAGEGEAVTLGDALVGEALVGVGVGLSDVGVGEAEVGVGVGVADVVGVGVFVGVGAALVGVGVGVGVGVAGSVALAVLLAVGAGVVPVGVGAAVSVGETVSEGVALREGIVGSETDGRPVGSEMLPLPPHAVRRSPPVSATTAIVAPRRARMLSPLVVPAPRGGPVVRLPSPDAGREAARPGGSQRQVQRRSAGTEAITWSTCWPQPDQVILPHTRQRAGLHMRTSILLGKCPGWLSPRPYPGGYSAPDTHRTRGPARCADR